MSDLATIECEQNGTTFVVRVAGEIDISNARELGGTIEHAVPKDVGVVVLDLGETRYLDSSGIALLLRLSDRLKGRRMQLRLVVPEVAPVRGRRHGATLPRVGSAVEPTLGRCSPVRRAGRRTRTARSSA